MSGGGPLRSLFGHGRDERVPPKGESVRGWGAKTEMRLGQLALNESGIRNMAAEALAING